MTNERIAEIQGNIKLYENVVAQRDVRDLLDALEAAHRERSALWELRVRAVSCGAAESKSDGTPTTALEAISDCLNRNWIHIDKARSRASAAEAERDSLRRVCGEAYQMAGVLEAPVEALDNLSAAANGRPIPHESFLPVDPAGVVAELRQQIDSLSQDISRSVTAESRRREELRIQLEASRAEAGRLRDALVKLRSYNCDIYEGRINYRPWDHIVVADTALAAPDPQAEAPAYVEPQTYQCLQCGGISFNKSCPCAIAAQQAEAPAQPSEPNDAEIMQGLDRFSFALHKIFPPDEVEAGLWVICEDKFFDVMHEAPTFKGAAIKFLAAIAQQAGKEQVS